MSSAPLDSAKIAGLRQLLARDGKATTKRGAVIERVDDERFPLVVHGPYGGRSRFTEDEIRRAYDLAVNGPPAKAQPRARMDFGDCPF